MSVESSIAAPGTSSNVTSRVTWEEKKVLTATLVGTTIEWYDFFVYAQAAGLAFVPLFFSPMTHNNPLLAQIISFATIGLSFLFRPLGAIISGHMGDRFGRRGVLVMTLILMGTATALIGLLPTYAQIGAWAPALLMFLRILQGFSAGGEWGGAALMSVEYAPVNRRSFFGSFPQIGTPLGMILATGVLWAMTAALGKQAMAEWGWRLPFLFSIVLIVIGAVIRRSVEESPVFRAMHQRRKESSAPLRELFRHHSGRIFRTALTFMANNAAGYILIAFIISYGLNTLKMPSDQLLLVSTLAAISWFAFMLLGGLMGDWIGRVRSFQIGYAIMAVWAIPMWFLIDSKCMALFFVGALGLTIGLGLSYGPQAALYAELFPAEIRYSGVSVSYALGAILGGAFAPAIAQWIIGTYGESWLVGLYIAVLSVISLIAVSTIKDPKGVDLNVHDHGAS
ncbi:MFS transporter [Bradyrhizobium sp. Ash2021]|uniref:MFS transporter n=1 Tax=Bradyrhizobium sp. Ash2021 TaxID=2954771 RepID=UPI002815258D|nr:MFS transporter [Bradyrhizobium sp. Ash2021]WMT79415.1 MHS family MFS transporter [Bradyrhizobium sp. Ash2021]